MVVDVLMSAVLLVQMSYSIAGELVHEILGITLFALFIAHHILAIPFTKGMFKNARTPLGAVKLALDVLLTLAMLCVILSALPISQYVFAFLGLSGLSSLGRAMHLAGAYQLFVLIGLHIGMHMDMMLAGLSMGCDGLRVGLEDLVGGIVAAPDEEDLVGNALVTVGLDETGVVHDDRYELVELPADVGGLDNGHSNGLADPLAVLIREGDDRVVLDSVLSSVVLELLTLEHEYCNRIRI